MKIRIQKLLAEQGVGSRRGIEKWITEGKIKVDNKIAELGQKIDFSNKVMINNKLIKWVHSKDQNQNTVVFIYHKPEGEICTRNDPEKRKTVFQSFPKLKEFNLNTGRWILVGRLDFNTSGLLLVTNNGELANKLMHPKYEMNRIYACRIHGFLNSDQKKQLLKGVKIDGQIMRFNKIELMDKRPDRRSNISQLDETSPTKNTWYRVSLKEGKNREVRKLWESQNLKLSRLMRVHYGGIDLPRSLKPGGWVQLTESQIKQNFKF